MTPAWHQIYWAPAARADCPASLSGGAALSLFANTEPFQLRPQVSDASTPASPLPGVSSLGMMPYQREGRGSLVQAASVEQQASGAMAGLLGAPETSRRLLAGRVRAPRLPSDSALLGRWGVSL